MSEWVNVKDRLPDKHDYYLVAVPDEDSKYLYHIGPAIYVTSHTGLDGTGDEIELFVGYDSMKKEWVACENVRYWMTLPKVPIEEAQE